MSSYSVVGQSVPRLDGMDKITGATRYGIDYTLPGMLHAKVLRSEHAHARIVNIDTSQAEALPGVEAVVTAKDAPDVLIGRITHDFTIFARDKVRHIGEAVAAVAAVDLETAEKALRLIRVEYEELPAVFDPHEALKPGAPQVHESHSDVLVGPHQVDGNVCATRRIRRGDITQGFADSDVVVENTFRTQAAEHCHLEPHASLAVVEPSGKATVWSSTAAPFVIRDLLARSLQMPISKIRIVSTAIGGAFGGKAELMCEAYCLLLARRTRKPVNMVATRKEEFTASTIRHPMTIQMKTGLKADGTLVARKVKIVVDCGAFCDIGDVTLTYACIFATGPYRVPNLDIEGVLAYTNQHVGGAMRGFGAMQAAFAYESEMDIIAARLDLDLVEIRTRNFVVDGDVTSTGQTVQWAGPKATLDAAMERADWTAALNSGDPRVKRGRGMACTVYSSGVGSRVDFAGAALKMNEDGSVSVSVSNAEVGQGAVTVLSQIVAEELGLAVDDVTINAYDTDTTPLDTIGAAASRTTFVCGGAAREAAVKARELLLQASSEILEARVEDLELKDRRVLVKGSPDKAMPVATVCQLASMKGQSIMSSANFKTDTGRLDPENGQGRPFEFLQYACAIADVEVDVQTGQVKILRVVSAHDCGKAINPLNVEGQVHGGVAMGVGFALTEEIQRENGRTLNPNLHDYKVPTSREIRSIVPVIIEGYGSRGPFGAKGVGEPPIIGVAPAIANAVY
ncbi:MAG: molybdopterin-dependent oxidoreductase, partial [Dehalococcoidia bacterium]|nr:molybdopterin-dependent oxidoreductase [Dehalococcoidia bacterium]